MRAMTIVVYAKDTRRNFHFEFGGVCGQGGLSWIP